MNNRYREVIDGKVYESTNNVLQIYVPKYASFAPEFGKGVHIAGAEAKVGDLAADAVSKEAKAKESVQER